VQASDENARTQFFSIADACEEQRSSQAKAG